MITVNSIPVSSKVARAFLNYRHDLMGYVSGAVFGAGSNADVLGYGLSFSSDDEKFGVFLEYRGFKIRLFHFSADGGFNERCSSNYESLRSTLIDKVTSWSVALGILARFDLDLFFLDLLEHAVFTPYSFSIPSVTSDSFTLLLGQPDMFMFTYRFDKTDGRGSFSCSGDARNVVFSRLPKYLKLYYDSEPCADGSIDFTAIGEFDSVEKRNEVIMGILSAYDLVQDYSSKGVTLE